MKTRFFFYGRAAFNLVQVFSHNRLPNLKFMQNLHILVASNERKYLKKKKKQKKLYILSFAIVGRSIFLFTMNRCLENVLAKGKP